MDLRFQSIRSPRPLILLATCSGQVLWLIFRHLPLPTLGPTGDVMLVEWLWSGMDQLCHYAGPWFEIEYVQVGDSFWVCIF